MSVLSEISLGQSEELIDSLSDAILEAIQDGTNEPNVVSRLTYGIPKYVNKLNLLIDGFKLSTGGVFIHQTPKVTFAGISKQKSIEIGDLLLVSTVVDGKDTTQKAMLYQAKMFKELPVEPDNINQHKLYESWPKFEYVRSGALNGQKREVKGLDLYSSAKYLLLSKSYPWLRTPYFWWHHRLYRNSALTAQATFPLSSHECFLKEVFHFALGDAGKQFKILTKSDPDIGWSRVINDLLDETSQKTTSHMEKASKGQNVKRGCGVFGNRMSFLSYYVQADISLEPNDNELPPTDLPPRPDNNDEDGGGISVIEFVLRREESQETRG
jgi:hypothetical protein